MTSQQQQMDSAAGSNTETAPEPGLGWEFRQTMSNTSNWSTAACYMVSSQGLLPDVTVVQLTQLYLDIRIVTDY